MNVLDLFSGIGGFSLGLERAGMRTVAFCEINPYCRAVLRKHWPAVPIFEDVRTLTAADVPGVDVIAGGFPCQDISVAGKGAGITGERSGLWSEFARLIGEIRPRYVIVENVAALLGRGIERVLGDLAALGFDAEWHCIPASAVGAPHRRDRVWIVAYAQRERGPGRREAGDVAGAQGGLEGEEDQRQWRRHAADDSGADVADTDAGRCEIERQPQHGEQQGAPRHHPDGCGAAGRRDGSDSDARRQLLEGWRPTASAWWESEPAMGELVNGVSGGLVRFDGRVASGSKDRVQKLRALGNAVVPQIPEIIVRAIMRST